MALLFAFRTWVLHLLDVALAWCRGLPALREKNAYLKGAACHMMCWLSVPVVSIIGLLVRSM